MFNRNGITFQSTGLAGENSTYAGEGVLSGIYQKAAFSLGGFHFQTDGWRTNAGQIDTISNAFLQLELSPKTNFQAEFRHRYTTQGDLQQRFFPDDFFPGLTQKAESFTVRLGGRQSFSPDSILLGSFMYQNRADQTRDESPPFFGLLLADLKRPQSAFSTELQHLFRWSWLNLTTGAGYFNINGKLRTTSVTILPPPFDIISTVTDAGVQHANAYTYANVNLLKNLTITVGASVDYVKGDSAEYSRWR